MLLHSLLRLGMMKRFNEWWKKINKDMQTNGEHHLDNQAQPHLSNEEAQAVLDALANLGEPVDEWAGIYILPKFIGKSFLIEDETITIDGVKLASGDRVIIKGV